MPSELLLHLLSAFLLMAATRTSCFFGLYCPENSRHPPVFSNNVCSDFFPPPPTTIKQPYTPCTLPLQRRLPPSLCDIITDFFILLSRSSVHPSFARKSTHTYPAPDCTSATGPTLLWRWTGIFFYVCISVGLRKNCFVVE